MNLSPLVFYHNPLAKIQYRRSKIDIVLRENYFRKVRCSIKLHWYDDTGLVDPSLIASFG